MWWTAVGTTPAVWLAALMVAWAGMLFGGLVYARTRATPAARMPAWTRLGSSLILVISAWSWLAVAWATPARVYALFIAVGMTLGFVGDLLMAGVFPLAQRVLAGMAAFAAGHVAYIAAILFGAGAANQSAVISFAAWAAWLAVGLLGWYVAVYRGAAPATSLHWAALAYTLLLSGTAGVASGLAAQAPGFIPLALGAALFLFSDLLIAVGLFTTRRHRALDDLVWLTYGPGQMLIVYSVGAALGIG